MLHKYVNVCLDYLIIILYFEESLVVVAVVLDT